MKLNLWVGCLNGCWVAADGTASCQSSLSAWCSTDVRPSDLIGTITPLTHADDGTLISGLQAFDAWHEDLGNPDGALIGLLNATGFLSGFCVGPVITYIDEQFGRKWGIRCTLDSLTETCSFLTLL